MLDPCASIEFSRGCPWDCSFCSAWTFYGRSYRLVSPERVVEDLASIREPGVFIVDDVAFIQDKHGMAIGEAIAREGIRKHYYLETRGDVLLRNKEVFKFWKTLGLDYMFLGIEAIDEDGLQKFRKRVPLGRNFEALEFARSLGIHVAINIIADPDWDEERFRVVREWCLDVPEVVNISVNTPYPGTESWLTEQRARCSTRDYRLFDIQHAVLPTRLPLDAFYRELLTTQRVLYRKHLNWWTAPLVARAIAGAPGARPDQFRPRHHELQQGLQPGQSDLRSRAARRLRAAAAGEVLSRNPDPLQVALRPRAADAREPPCGRSRGRAVELAAARGSPSPDRKAMRDRMLDQ